MALLLAFNLIFSAVIPASALEGSPAAAALVIKLFKTCDDFNVSSTSEIRIVCEKTENEMNVETAKINKLK